MISLELPSTNTDRNTAAWTASLLVALARDEVAGRRPARLTEPGLATWNRFRGRLSAPDFIDLLFEDAAVLHHIPFALSKLGGTGQAPNQQELGGTGQAPNQQKLGGTGQAPNQQKLGGTGQAPNQQKLGGTGQAPNQQKLGGTGQAPNQQKLGGTGQAPNQQKLGGTGQAPNQQDQQEIASELRASRLPSALCERWLEALPGLELRAKPEDYIAAQARLLGVPSRLARSELHVVKPHHKVLELPGTGGQLAHHLVSTHAELSLRDNFTVACGSWRELTLAGIVGLDLAAPNTDFAVAADGAALRDPEHPLRQGTWGNRPGAQSTRTWENGPSAQSTRTLENRPSAQSTRNFDFVLGLHPDKGGLFRVDDQLAIWFSGAKILLV
ncbi:MAG: hypothetical protein RBU37_17235 [Myxococcota bacterium]|nr:hypothetical protein [Myxococcota bacterium]